MVFAEENPIALFDEIKPLITKHHEEIAPYKDIPLEPCWERYAAAADAGVLKVFTIRDEVGQGLIGYFVTFMNKNIHYESSLQATQDILYIEPEHRGAMSKEFIAWCDDQLKEKGVQVVYRHVTPTKDYGSLLNSLGYEEIEKVYGRRL